MKQAIPYRRTYPESVERVRQGQRRRRRSVLNTHRVPVPLPARIHDKRLQVKVSTRIVSEWPTIRSDPPDTTPEGRALHGLVALTRSETYHRLGKTFHLITSSFLHENFTSPT